MNICCVLVSLLSPLHLLIPCQWETDLKQFIVCILHVWRLSYRKAFGCKTESRVKIQTLPISCMICEKNDRGKSSWMKLFFHGSQEHGEIVLGGSETDQRGWYRVSSWALQIEIRVRLNQQCPMEMLRTLALSVEGCVRCQTYVEGGMHISRIGIYIQKSTVYKMWEFIH